MAGLAKPGDDQPPFGVANEIGRGREGCAEIGLQRCGNRGNAAALGIEGAQGRRNGGVCEIGPG